jgi:hypothetical protein
MDNRPVDFYYFTGTGNTLLVARAMAEVFAARGLEVTLRRIEAADPAQVDVRRTLGIAFPVAVWTTYPVVGFRAALPTGQGAPASWWITLGGSRANRGRTQRAHAEPRGIGPTAAREIRCRPTFHPK